MNEFKMRESERKATDIDIEMKLNQGKSRYFMRILESGQKYLQRKQKYRENEMKLTRIQK